MRKAFLVVALVCLSVFVQASTTVSGNLKSLATGNVTNRAFVRFEIINCGVGIPRILGTGVIPMKSVDMRPNGSGVFSGTLYSSSEIDCGGAQNTRYKVTVFYDGVNHFAPQEYIISGATWSLNSASVYSPTTPPTYTPQVVIKNPTGDQTIVQTAGTKFSVGNMYFDNLQLYPMDNGNSITLKGADGGIVSGGFATVEGGSGFGGGDVTITGGSSSGLPAGGNVVITPGGGSTPGTIQLNGVATAKNLNGIRYADQFANIQAAITDAGTTGSVVIPSSYTGVDTYTNPNKIPVTDLRLANSREVLASAFGAKMDGSTDDLAKLQAAIDSFGHGRTASTDGDKRPAGGTVKLDRGTVISDTLYLSHGVTLDCGGWGSTLDGTAARGYIKWGGPAGVPMIVIRASWGNTLKNCRLIGNSAAKPSIMVEVRDDPLPANGQVNLTTIDNVKIGSISGYDSDNASQFVDGLVFTGNQNNDSNRVNMLSVARCDGAALKIANSQALDIHVENFFSGQCANMFAMPSGGVISGTNWFTSQNTEADFKLGGGSNVFVRYYDSEHPVKMAQFDGGGSTLEITGGRTLFWAAEADEPQFIDGYGANKHVKLIFRDFQFIPETSIKNTWKIKMRGDGVSTVSTGTIDFVNVTGVSANNLDLNTWHGTDVRSIRIFNPWNNSNNVLPIMSQNVLIGSDTYDDLRVDLLGKVNVFGGDFTVKKLATPASTCAVAGGSGTTYTYKISAMSGGRESALGTVTCSGGAALGGAVTNTLTIRAVRGADAFKVYGRTGGGELLMTTLYPNDFVGTPVTFTDNGSLTPSGALPTVDTSGQALIEGPLTLGSGTAIKKHLSATASLDFAAWAGTDCQSLTITVTGAADGDTASAGIPNALASTAGVVWTQWVSGANTVTVRGCKITAGASADPAAATVRADVWQH